MPVIVAFFARQLIIIGVQLGIFALIDKFVTPLLNTVLNDIMVVFGVSESTAQDILHNEILTTAETLGMTVALSKARLPLALADKLGFSTRGFKKIALNKSVEEKVNAKRGATSGVAPIQKIPTEAEATTIIQHAKKVLPGFGQAYSVMIRALGTTFIGLMVIGNWIDFGNWNNGAYQKKMQTLIATVTFGLLTPDEGYRKSLTLSSTVFSKIYNTYKINGAIAINDPFKKLSEPFSRNNLIDLIDKVGAKMLLTVHKASTKDVLTVTQLMIVFNPDAITTGSATPTAEFTPAVAVAPSVKSTHAVRVFTGLLSSGTLGAQKPFTPRESGLITSANELAQDAQQEATSFLSALPGSIVYEVRIVNYVIANDGTKRTGRIQRIQTGTLKSGQPRYRILHNKFAVLDLYYNIPGPGRKKLIELIIGPVDVGSFNPTPADIASITGTLKNSVATTNVADIAKVITAQPITTISPTTPATPQVSQEVSRGIQPQNQDRTNISAPQVHTEVPAPAPVHVQTHAPAPTPAPQATQVTPTSETLDFSKTRISNGEVYNLPNSSGNFYSGPVRSAPTISMAALYELKGLGPASTYAGTATQIARLDQLA